MAEQIGYEEAVLQRVAQQLEPMAKAMAAEMGPPPASKTYSQQDELSEWNYSPIGDPETRAQAMLQLHQLGKTPEEITDAVYPNRRRLITTGRPLVQEQIAFAGRMAKLMTQKAAEAGMAPPMQPPPAPPPMQPQPMGGPTGMPGPTPAAPPLPITPPVAPTAPAAPAPSILDRPIASVMGG